MARVFEKSDEPSVGGNRKTALRGYADSARHPNGDQGTDVVMDAEIQPMELDERSDDDDDDHMEPASTSKYGTYANCGSDRAGARTPRVLDVGRALALSDLRVSRLRDL